MLRIGILSLAFALLAAFSGCRSAYYSAMETFGGKHKRDILVDRVEAAQEDQEQAKQQFRTALERFNGVVALPQTDLKTKYESLSDELERCEEDAQALRDRIDSIQQVAEDLFDEWESELDDYSSSELRRASERQLRETRSRYERLMSAMRRAEQSMEPVLTAFRDNVLFLKHNLNAQAIASLQGELDALEDDTAELIRQMEAAIAEAEAFIAQMRSGQPDT